MEYKFLKAETPEAGICILSISHPQSLNSLSRPVLEEINSFVLDLPEGTAVLIIRGDGPKSFVAGADISQMAQDSTLNRDWTSAVSEPRSSAG